jgi:hypothetical protein
MQINFTIWATGPDIVTNKLRYIAREQTPPGFPVVVSMDENPKHTFPHNVTLNVPNPIPHIVSIYSTPDSSQGILVAEFLYDPTYSQADIRPTDVIIVGGSGPYDPAVGSNTFTVTDLSKWNFTLERRANGGTQIINNEYSVSGNTITLNRADDVFNQGEVLFIHYDPKISTATPVFNYLNLYSGFELVTESKTLDATYYKKIISIAAAGTNISVTMPPINDIPDFTSFFFETMEGNQKQSTLIAGGAAYFKYKGQNLPKIFPGQCESLTIVKITNNGTPEFRIVSDFDGMNNIGRYFYSDDNVNYLNAVYLDGSSLPISDYPRLDWYLSLLSPGIVFSTLAARTTAGDAGSSRWVRDITVGLIYKPDTRGTYERGLPGNRGNDDKRNAGTITGTYAGDQLLQHNHSADSSKTNIFFIKRVQNGPGGGFGVNNSASGWEKAENITGGINGVFGAQTSVRDVSRYHFMTI